MLILLIISDLKTQTYAAEHSVGCGKLELSIFINALLIV